jgi:hypothetical protein
MPKRSHIFGHVLFLRFVKAAKVCAFFAAKQFRSKAFAPLDERG